MPSRLFALLLCLLVLLRLFALLHLGTQLQQQQHSSRKQPQLLSCFVHRHDTTHLSYLFNLVFGILYSNGGHVLVVLVDGELVGWLARVGVGWP